MADSRNRILLAVAAVLAALRFVAVPWLDAHAEARERVQVLTQRLDRSAGVVQNRAAILAARTTLSASTVAARERFPKAASIDAYRLDSQRGLGALVTAAGAQMTLFDWLLDGRIDQTGLSYGRVRFSVEGPLRDVVRAHADIEGSLPNLLVRESTLNLVSPAQGPDTTRGTLTIVADLFFQPQSSSPAVLPVPGPLPPRGAAQ